MASTESMISGVIASSDNTDSTSAAQNTAAVRPRLRLQVSSVTSGLQDRLQDIRRLRQDFVFELRVVGHGRVERADAGHRRVEAVEELSCDPRGDLGAEAARELIFVRHDDAA